MSKKVFIINGDRDYNNLFKKFDFELTDHIDKASLVVFTGGADVSPNLYGDAQHPATWNSPYRDLQEQQLYLMARESGTPMVGICRGAQFLNVMNGGRMYQDVGSHAIAHGHTLVDVENGQEVLVTSTHHQMMMPHESAKVVAIARQGSFREWVQDCAIQREEVSLEDYEVLFYEKSKSLCFQPHPEFVGAKWEPMKEYFHSLLQRYLGM